MYIALEHSPPDRWDAPGLPPPPSSLRPGAPGGRGAGQAESGGDPLWGNNKKKHSDETKRKKCLDVFGPPHKFPKCTQLYRDGDWYTLVHFGTFLVHFWCSKTGEKHGSGINWYTLVHFGTFLVHSWAGSKIYQTVPNCTSRPFPFLFVIL